MPARRIVLLGQPAPFASAKPRAIERPTQAQPSVPRRNAEQRLALLGRQARPGWSTTWAELGRARLGTDGTALAGE
jgi:hypothetical protein